MTRAVIVSLTLAALITIWIGPPTPSRKYFPGQGEIPLVVNDTIDFCFINYKAAFKNHLGQWQYGWAGGYGPCELQDEYRNI